MLNYITKTSKKGKPYPVLLYTFKSGKSYTLNIPLKIRERIIEEYNLPEANK